MAHLPKKKNKIDVQLRLKLASLAADKKLPISLIAKQYSVSRSFLYRLKSDYLLTSRSLVKQNNSLIPKENWTRIGRSLSETQTNAILQTVLEDPSLGYSGIIRKIISDEKFPAVSLVGLRNFLIKLDLKTVRKRTIFSEWAGRLPVEQLLDMADFSIKRKYLKNEPLSPEERLKALRFVENHAPVAYICRIFHISKANYYKWQKRYQKSLPGKEYQSVENRKPLVEHYPSQASRKVVELVLKIAIDQPELSSHKIAAILPRVNGRSLLGNHGVQNTLRRLSLNTIERRMVYSQEKKSEVAIPVFGSPAKFKKLIGSIPVVSSIPPPLQPTQGKPLRRGQGFGLAQRKLLRTIALFISRFVSSLPQQGKFILNFLGKLMQSPQKTLQPLWRPFVTSLISSTTIFSLFVFWINLLAQAPSFGGKVGLVFATIALIVGGFFFAYSMKYYFILALVLSFSRRTEGDSSTHSARSGPWGNSYSLSLNGKIDEENGGNGGNWGLKNWLAKVFGLSVRQTANQPDIRTVWQPEKGGGLQPSLDHVSLGRKPFFSIHLPFYNEKKVAERIMKACASMDYYEKGRACFELIVCDDSTDETVEIVERFSTDWNKSHDYGPKIKVLHRPTREGFKGGALSYALKALDPATEFVCVFDADFVPYPDSLTQFLKYFKATGGWNEEKDYKAANITTIPYLTNDKVTINSTLEQQLDHQAEQLRVKSPIAVVAGYQWHVLNKSENWITRGVRTEYAGSYVIERPGQEILGAMKIIHGSVYAIRADVLKHFGWGTSITEDYELTLRIYEKGFKVAFTPYIQAPSECVSTIKRLIRQRMRWAEGHSFNTRKQFKKLIFNPKLTLMEKLEFLYLTPYYLQAAFFLLGTFSWLLSETVFRTKLPFWTDLWGWSLVLTNFFALPLVNAVGLFLEESEERDYLGLLSFVLLCYILTPFQAYAAVKGMVRKTEGPWFRTPKTGNVTDIFRRGSFYRWISGIIPIKNKGLSIAQSLRNPAVALTDRRRNLGPPAGGLGGLGEKISPYLSLVTANNRFAGFQVKRKHLRGATATLLIILILFSSTLFQLLPTIPVKRVPPVLAEATMGMGAEADSSGQSVNQDNQVSQGRQNEQGSTQADSREEKTEPVKPAVILTDNRHGNGPSVRTTSDSQQTPDRPAKKSASGIQLSVDYGVGTKTESKTQETSNKEGKKNILSQTFGPFSGGEPFDSSSSAELTQGEQESRRAGEGNIFERTADIGNRFLVWLKSVLQKITDFLASIFSKFFIWIGIKEAILSEANQGNEETSDSQKLTLAINTNKSTYQPGETAKITLAVLNEKGEMVCDSKLGLSVQRLASSEKTFLSTGNGSIKVNPECQFKGYTDKPDYEAKYQFNNEGEYQLVLTAETNQGQTEIATNVKVDKNAPFDIERNSNTRIYPPVRYPMIINVIPASDFKGTITEQVPANFELITEQARANFENSVVLMEGKTTTLPTKVAPQDNNADVKNIVWEVDWKKDQLQVLYYEYRVPKDSPAFYELGPIRLVAEASRSGQALFQETRAWQLAVDVAQSDIIFSTASEFETANARRQKSAVLDTNKFVICYTSGASTISCTVGTVSGTTVTWGAEASLTATTNNAIGSPIGTCKLDTDKFAVAYTLISTDGSHPNDGFTLAATVATDTITFGTAVEFSGHSDAIYIDCEGIATDKWAIGYDDTTVGTGVICTASGTTVTCGAETDYNATDYQARYNNLAKLDTDKFVAAFESEDDGTGYVVAATVSTTTPTFGTPVQYTADNPVSNYVCSPQDSDRFLLVYSNLTDTSGEAIVGTVSTTTISLGSATDINPTSSGVAWPGCTFVDNRHVVIAFSDSGLASDGVAKLCEVDWSARTISCGVEEIFEMSDTSGNFPYRGMETISGYGSTAKIMIAFVEDTPTSEDGEVVIGDVIEPDIVFDEASEIDAGINRHLISTKIGINKLVTCRVEGGTAAQCNVGSVNGTTITWGAAASVATTNNEALSPIGVCQLDTDKFAVTYTLDSGNATNPNDGFTRIGTVSGNTITFGTTKEFNDGTVRNTDCVGVDKDRWLIGSSDTTVGQSVLCTANGSTVSCGAITDYNATDYDPYYNTLTKIDTNKAVVAFESNDDSTGYVIAATAQGDVPVFGTPVQFTADDPNHINSCSPDDADRFVLTYRNVTDTSGETMAGTVSGTDITLGAAYDFNATSNNVWYTDCSFIDDTHFVVAYSDNNNHDFGVAKVCQVTWSDRSITCTSGQIFAGQDIGYSWNRVSILTLGGYSTDAKIFIAHAGNTGATETGAYSVIGDIKSDGTTVSILGEFELHFDRSQGGVIDSWYDLENDSGKADQLADTTDGLFDFYGTDGTTRRISDSTYTTQKIVEITDSRVVLNYEGNLGERDYDYVLTSTIHTQGQINIKLAITNNTGGTVTWTSQMAEITVDSTTNHTADGDGVTSNGQAMTPGTNNWVKWVGDGTTEKDTATLYYYSGFNYVEYYTSGTKVAFERDTSEEQANLATTTRIFRLDLRPDTDVLGTDETEPDKYSADFRSPDRLTYTTGSIWDNQESPIFASSFDGADADLCGGGDGWTTGTCDVGNTAVGNESTTVSSPTYGAKFTLGGTNDTAIARKNFGSSYETVYGRVNFRIGAEGLSSGNAIAILNFQDTTVWQNATVNIRQDSGGNLELGVSHSGNTWAGSDGYLSIGTWYTLEFKVYSHATAGTMDLWLNGTNILSTTQDTGDYNKGSVTLGLNWMAGVTFEMYYDNFVVFTSDSYAMNAAADSSLSQSSKVQFDIDGGTTNRFQPSFKIRKWRSTDLPIAASLEGTVLFPSSSYGDSYNYSASIKPITEAWQYYDGGYPTAIQMGDGGDPNTDREYLGRSLYNYTPPSLGLADYLYLGSEDQFTGVNYFLNTVGAGGVITWEFWDGNSWEDLANVTDVISGSDDLLKTNGSFYFDEPTDWAAYTLTATELGTGATGERSIYWIRADITDAYETVPVIDRMWTDILLFQYYGNITADSQTFLISSDPITQGRGSIQIDVPNRYRMVMDTADTDNYLQFFDRAQSDSSPVATHEFKGPCIKETNVYCLRDDASRVTTVLESNDIRVRVRVSGAFGYEGSTGYLTDTDNTITVVEDYTFTTEGVFISNTTDFRDGLGLDADGGAGDHAGYEWLGVYADVTDAAFDHTANIYYGDGTTESSTTTDGAEWEDSNTYVNLPGKESDTYQDAFIGISKDGWYDDAISGTDEWQYDIGEDSGTQDLVSAQEQAYTSVGIHQAKWYFLLQAEDSLDTEAERESYNNDFRNPDTLTFTTGSEWQDPVSGIGSAISAPHSASPGLYFDGTTDYVTMGDVAAFDFTDNDFTMEAWFYRTASDEDTIIGKRGGRTSASKGYLLWIDSATDKLVFEMADSTPDEYSVTGTTTIETNRWYHVAAVYDDDSTSNTTIYLNGVDDKASTSGTLANIGELANAVNFRIGAESDDDNAFNGRVDETRLWGDVRTQAEIQQYMFTTVAGNADNILGYWRLNENSGASANDETANNNDGTVTNALWITGYVPDGYNEVEGAYTADASGSQINIDLDGATYTRHKPMFKIRKYYQNTKPSSITLEGSGLVEGTNYYTDFKPFSDSYFADKLTWYSTLESAGAVTSPDVGAAGTTSGATFPAGRYGNGALFDADSEYVTATVANTTDFDKAKGAVEFWYQPIYAHTADAVDHTLFRLYVTDANNQIKVLVDSSDNLSLVCTQGGTSVTYSITSSNYSWNAYDWVHLRAEWDDSAALVSQQKIFVNGVEPATHSDSATDFDSNAMTSPTTLMIGNSLAAGTDEARGIIDELKIFTGVSTEPDDLAQGGDLADSEEYLFSEDRDYALDFAAVDANGRGEYWYLGADTMFQGVNVDLGTIGATAGSLNLDWEYWNGSSWASLESITGFTDGSSNLTQDGALDWDVNPTNWRPYSMNGSPDLYYIRASLNNSSGAYSTYPIENLIRTDIVFIQYLSNITSDSQTLVVVPENLWPVAILGLLGMSWTRRRKKTKMYDVGFRM